MSAQSEQIGGDHYRSMSIQPERFIYENGIGFHEGSAIKYLCRWRRKGGVQDLEKAKHFIDLLIAHQDATPEKSDAPQPEPPAPELPRLNTGWKWAPRDGTHVFTGYDWWFNSDGSIDKKSVHKGLGGIYLPWPLATPDWHNPDNIPEPGKGYRFLVKGENAQPGDEFYIGAHMTWRANDTPFPTETREWTHRTTRPLPPVLADEKEVQP